MTGPLPSLARRAAGLLLACLALALPAHAQSGVDVVFMVDGSREAANRDLSDSRFQLAKAIVDKTRDRGPQSIAVVPLGGEGDHAAGRLTVLPPVALSGDMGEDWRVLARDVRPAFDGIGSEAASLDLPHAFELLATTLADRDRSRPLWVVLLSNGDADPITDNAFPDRYAQRAGELAEADGFDADSPDRQHIKDATKEALLETAPAVLVALGDEVVLTVVNVDRDRARVMVEHSQQPVLQRLSDRTGKRPVIDLDGTNIAEAANQAIAQAPFPPRVIGAAGPIVIDLESLDQPKRFHLYQGTTWARVVIDGNHGEYDTSLKYVQGGANVDHVSSGSDSAVRVLDMLAAPPKPGEVELVITPRGDAGPLGATGRLEFELDLQPVLTAPKAGALHAVGEPFELSVQLADFDGKPITDQALLARGRVVATWTDPMGSPPADTWATDGASHSFSYAPGQPSGAAASYGWKLAAALLPAGGGKHHWTWERSGKLKTEVWVPSVTLSYREGDDGVEYAETESGRSVGFHTDYVSGATALEATFALEADLRGAKQMPVSLAFEPSDTFAAALDAGSTSFALHLDGKPVVGGVDLVVGPDTPGVVTVTAGKTGFGSFGDSMGTLVARTTGGAGEARIELAMSPVFGTASILALLALIALIVAIVLLRRAAARRRIWPDTLASLTDDDVLVFDDDEGGARRAA